MAYFELLGTAGCHLCEEAQALLFSQTDALGFRFVDVDIVDDEQLLADYALRIPVLRDGALRELGWPFTSAELAEFILAIPSA